MKTPELTTLCYLVKDGKYLMMHRVKKEKDINKMSSSNKPQFVFIQDCYGATHCVEEMRSLYGERYIADKKDGE